MKEQNDFVATVSHELRTPLTSIRGFAQTLLASWNKISEDDKKKFIKIIEEQSNRLIELVENILAVSSGNDTLLLKKADIKLAVEPVIKIVNERYPDYVINTKFNPKLPEGMIDIERFQQIAANLAENACKYSPAGSCVTIIGDFADNQEGFFSLKVIDEGIGIDEKNKERIFEKFARIDNPLTRTVPGNGLGLYITKQLVEKMNGTICFYNNGKGTTFEVKLPFYNPEEQVCSVVS